MEKKPRQIAALMERGIFLLSIRLHADVSSMAIKPEINSGTSKVFAIIINETIMIISSEIKTAFM